MVTQRSCSHRHAVLHGDSPCTQESSWDRTATLASRSVHVGLVIHFRSCDFYYRQLKFTAIKSPPASMLRKVHRTLSSSTKAEWNNVKLVYKPSYKDCSIKMKGPTICKMWDLIKDLWIELWTQLQVSAFRNFHHKGSPFIYLCVHRNVLSAGMNLIRLKHFKHLLFYFRLEFLTCQWLHEETLHWVWLTSSLKSRAIKRLQGFFSRMVSIFLQLLFCQQFWKIVRVNMQSNLGSYFCYHSEIGPFFRYHRN